MQYLSIFTVHLYHKGDKMVKIILHSTLFLCTAYIVPLKIRQIKLQAVPSNSNVVVGIHLVPSLCTLLFHRWCPDPQSFRDLIRTVHPKVRRKCTCTKKKKMESRCKQRKEKEEKLSFEYFFFLKKYLFK